jgi:hypothetical protein
MPIKKDKMFSVFVLQANVSFANGEEFSFCSYIREIRLGFTSGQQVAEPCMMPVNSVDL